MKAQPSHHRARSAAMVTTMLAVFTTVLASPAHATPPGATISLAPPYDEARDYSSCDDGDGTANCTAESFGNSGGGLSTHAALSPKSTLATGRALGHGGVVTHHRLPRPVPAVRYTVDFSDLDAAWAGGLLRHDWIARGSLGVSVVHPGCSNCTATAELLLVDNDPVTTTPSIRRGSESLVIELRNPAGDLPSGVITVMALSSASVSSKTDAPSAEWERTYVYVMAVARSLTAQVLAE